MPVTAGAHTLVPYVRATDCAATSVVGERGSVRGCDHHARARGEGVGR